MKYIYCIAILLCICIYFNSKSSDLIEVISASPDGRTEWRSMMRNNDMAPKKILAAREAVRKEFPREQKHLRDAGINLWEEQGPTKVGGRVRAIAIHPTNPDILYLGGVSGGLWRSANGGTTWNPIGDFLPSLAVTSILIHPTNPDTMFLSTGEGVVAAAGKKGLQRQPIPGAGIIRSFDAGMTWERIPAITSINEDKFYWINKIIFKPDDPSKLVAVGHDKNQDGEDQIALGGVLHYLSNYGAMVQDFDNFSDRGGFIDVEWPLGKDSLLVGSQFNLMVFSYQAISDFLFLNSDRGGLGGLPNTLNLGRVEIDVSPLNKDKVYVLCQDINTATFGRLFVSNDFGFNWSELDFEVTGTADPVNPFMTGPGGNQGWYDNSLWISPINDDHILVGGIDLWRSLDGGDNFTKISDWPDYAHGEGDSPHADHHIIVESTDFSSGNKQVYFGNDGGIAKSDNYETVTENSGWSLINNNLSITQIYNSGVRQNGTIVAGAQDNGTSFTNNGGANWIEVSGGDGGYCGFGLADTIYYSTQFGNFYRYFESSVSVQGIASLSNVMLAGILNCSATGVHFPMQVDDNPSFIAPLEVFPSEPNRLLIAGENLWISDNGGCDFFQVSPTAAVVDTQITAIEIGESGKVIVGYKNGKVYRAAFGTGTSPATPAWVQIDGGTFDGPITDIAISSENPSKIAVSVGGYNDDNIFVSFNNGSTWLSRSNGIPALHVNTLLWHHESNNWLYAGTDLGVFSTEDSGLNWNTTPNYSGISDGPVFTEITNLEWGPFVGSTPFKYLYATTYGRGVWRSKNAVRQNVYVDEDYVGTEWGTYINPFDRTEDAEAIQAHGQTWYFDAQPNSSDPKTLYSVPAGGVLIDKRIGVIKKKDGKNGSIVIGEN